MRTPEQIQTRKTELIATHGRANFEELGFCYSCGSFGFEDCHPDCADHKLFLQQVAACAANGHNFKDEGHVGPDSGEIDLICQDCGAQGTHHILY